MSESVQEYKPAPSRGIEPEGATVADVVASQTVQNRHGVLDKPVSELITLNWEFLAWAVLLIIAAVARFYMLGVRAMSHDESLHALYSYYLYDAGNYEHNPMMHGPLLFHINALVYFLFGDSDFTARLGPAVAGLALVAMFIPYRRFVGRVGALAVGILVAFSPSLLFHSRYIRNDIYIALFAVVWIYALFRYFEAANNKRSRWLLVMTLAMAFGFVTKENFFLFGALMGAWTMGLALWHVLESRTLYLAALLLLAAGAAFWLYETGFTLYAMLLGGIGAIAALILLVLWLSRSGWSSIRNNRPADLAVLTLTLVLPFGAPVGHVLLGWDPLASATTMDIVRSAILVAIMAALSVGLAVFWFGMRDRDEFPAGITLRQWAWLMATFWVIQILFFTTFLTNTRNGLASGIVGSLGYWMAQQEVARGGQPWFYYIMLGGLYEFLPIALSVGGILTILRGVFGNAGWDPVASVDPPPSADSAAWQDDSSAFSAHENRRLFAVFGIVWIVGSWTAYMVAGEKMPWLMTHIALPMCVVGGWWFAWLVYKVAWRKARQAHALWLIAAGPALLFLLIVMVSSGPIFGRSTVVVGNTLQWIMALLAFALLAYAVYRAFSRTTWRDGVVLLGLGGVALLFLLTIRFTYMLNYINYDMATEYLVYAHGSPDIKRALAEIDKISERTVGDRNIVVAYDDESSWPMSWYMRLYPNARFYGSNPTSETMTAPVILVGPKNFEAVRPYVARDYVKRPYRRIWWPDQSYMSLTLQQVFDTLRSRDKMKRLFDIAFYRRYPDAEDPTQPRDLTEWPSRSEMEMYVRRDIAEDIWDLSLAPVVSASSNVENLALEREVDLAASNIFSATYDGLPLLTPRAIATDARGRIVIADTGNHRVVVLNSDGELLFTIGSLCRLGEGEAGGCIDPDGSGRRLLGDGQFNEPWGVAVDSAGNIYVADTWNGRIQVFNESGLFQRSWGYFNTTDGELGDPFAMFGPRGVAVDLDGNLLVADTGNKRILRFNPYGEFIDQVGGGGVILGRFEEPTDVAVSPVDGTIYVADNWNRRIQKLDPQLQPLVEWPVPGWESREIYHKPSISVAENGDVYISDPEYYRVVVFSPAGELKASFGDYGTDNNRFALPNGVDASQDSVLVADADNNRVMQFPLLP